MRTTKSARRVLETDYLMGQLVFSPWSHKFSPGVFTQPQLFACLVFTEFMRLDYRRLAQTLADALDFSASLDWFAFLILRPCRKRVGDCCD